MSTIKIITNFLDKYGFPEPLPDLLPLDVALALQAKIMDRNHILIDLTTLELCFLGWKRSKKSAVECRLNCADGMDN